MTARLTKIELQGFRSFGRSRQTIDLPNSVAVFWGGNSQGKTSFVEALEFLLTGHIIRREMLASSKDEFADALRNVHIGATDTVWVAGTVVCIDGTTRIFKRTLIDDYRKGSAAGCVSRLHLNDQPCGEEVIETVLGFKLSHPPLRAPVLSQHTLAHLFSITPSDRATYFRAVLDTQDLEAFRNAVAALQPLLKAPVLPELTDLAAVEAIPALASAVGKLSKAKSESDLSKALSVCCSTLLSSLAMAPVADLSAQVNQIDVELQRRRAQTFSVDLFGRAQLGLWQGMPATVLLSAGRYLTEKAKVDAETRRLTELFSAALLLPAHPEPEQPIDCPLCGAEETLTAGRLLFIREQVEATTSFTEASGALLAALRNLDGQLDALQQTVFRAKPKFMRVTGGSRRRSHFTMSAIKLLISDIAAVEGWMSVVRQLWRSMSLLQRSIAIAREMLQSTIANPDCLADTGVLEACLNYLDLSYTKAQSSLTAYEAPAKSIGENIKAKVDQSADTKGWEALVRIGRQPSRLWSALEVTKSHIEKSKRLEKALTEIDDANGKVMDEKFIGLSAGVRDWWDLLRPDEATFFDGIQRRSAKTKRTIDLKVGLSANDDRSDPKIRDAIAVFSQSQTHCLGLALFLARAIEEGSRLVILDDPVLTSDDDYRPNFVSSVIEALLNTGVQVIICTQDHKSWKDIGDRWNHRGAVQYQIIRSDAVLGTEIRNLSDDLATMLARAQPATKSQDPVVRKEGAIRLREAIERFGKMMLVRYRQQSGDMQASITDYDGKNYGTYSAQVIALLTKDPSHPGKLKAAYNYVTPGPHDDKPPAAGELKLAYGDLNRLKKDYLD